ncbi:hypothetical protein BASA50_006430 [Batrachochytrium salamandrivorans]|uniref:Inositol-1-monophosphatase n=1 Tax=Batrachochytrium salamandrivorans TaxID=1357716 RepID=A0ABQ8FAM0_9FUNG|nr:hypothetical protein BASA60_010145 [Batrachochytrium salamandrivorans]KAH6574707.1 hypothetical protein BASA62_002335 [Batrachochytrium salamandrivorans]KAH6594755.1 hypothetical protein BASA50_006430 [Batrachochytrium salamandrivorans]KAH6596804.1 hypothetical protein BASA61_003338 [Batrachochytrium salamandrivorans]KAH9276685.1 hypothetical protein BASA83_000817 [Batrachochytrium salamandrivorans]
MTYTYPPLDGATAEQLSGYLEKAIAVATDAGAIIRTAYMGRSHAIDFKEANAADLVTKTDCAVEELCFRLLRASYPDHAFIGEESTSSSTSSERCPFDDRPTWIIDPIDGTMNFCHGFPYTAISIGLCISKVPVVGVVFNPVLDHLYYAAAGQGAYLRSPAFPTPQLLPLNSSWIPSSLSTALIATEYGASKDTDILTAKIATIQRIVTQPVSGRGIRSCGSAALSMCLVAEGGVDAYYEAGIHAWDICAGILLVREAGGIAVNLLPASSAQSLPISSKDDGIEELFGSEPVDVMARSVLCVRGVQKALADRKDAHAMTTVASAQAALVKQLRSLMVPLPYPLD